MLRRAIIITLVLVVSLMVVMPAVASPVATVDRFDLIVNGEAAVSIEVYGENGVSLIPVDGFVRLAGADLEWNGDNSFTITENGQSMAFVVGQKEALLDGANTVMPVAPVKLGEKVYVPLRFVTTNFGFEVTWDEQQRLILMEREEIRDGLLGMV